MFLDFVVQSSIFRSFSSFTAIRKCERGMQGRVLYTPWDDIDACWAILMGWPRERVGVSTHSWFLVTTAGQKITIVPISIRATRENFCRLEFDANHSS